jgi:DNA-binding CsgD family transcriptional regulator
MNVQIPPRVPDLFSPTEYEVLKSMALGFSCEEIRKLLNFHQDQYESVCKGLFEKLQASNHYTAVKTAYQKKYLDRKELSSNEVKSFSLEFAYKNVEKLKASQEDSKQLLWRFYDLLMEFHTQIESQY